MYPVSDAFVEAINSNTRKYYWTGTVATKDKRTYDFTNRDIVKGSAYVTRQCCGSTEIELGTVYAAELGITLYSDIDRYTLDEAEIRLFFHLFLLDGTEEVVPMGIFEISEANRSVKCLEIKAYDYMLRFEKTARITASSGKPFDYLHIACQECKVEMAQSQAEIEAMTNGKETFGVYNDNDIESYRDLLYYVAQVLGCVCQINREGKLVLIPYGTTPVQTIPQKGRFTSTYSDFVTRYTAISSTNSIKEIAEYYAVKPDDGLTMNLGVNPLLQFGVDKTRERILNAILNAVTQVEYVPFESTTIGNPALDPMDILVFSGGHADETKISCITSINYKINGKHTLKCVGSNPKLSAAKSKNDKNISGLLNSIDSSKTVVYSFTNAAPFIIGETMQGVLSISFTSKEETTAMFLAEILMDVEADEEDRKVDGTYTTEDEEGQTLVNSTVFSFTGKQQPEISVVYKINDELVDTFFPKQKCVGGNQILTLFYPLSNVLANAGNTFDMFLKVTGGTIKIEVAQIRATISGQGLVAGIGDWNGRIAVSDTIDRILMDEEFLYIPVSDRNDVVFPPNGKSAVVQPITRIAFMDTEFGYDALNERVTAVELIKTFTMDKTFPPYYNPIVVEVDENGAYHMIEKYVFVSAEENINSGTMQRLTVNTEPFEQVEEVSVSRC